MCICMKHINNQYSVDILKWWNECIYLTVDNFLIIVLKWAVFHGKNNQLESAGLAEWELNKLFGKVIQTMGGVQMILLVILSGTVFMVSIIFSKGLSSFPLYKQSSYCPA